MVYVCFVDFVADGCDPEFFFVEFLLFDPSFPIAFLFYFVPSLQLLEVFLCKSFDFLLPLQILTTIHLTSTSTVHFISIPDFDPPNSLLCFLSQLLQPRPLFSTQLLGWPFAAARLY